MKILIKIFKSIKEYKISAVKFSKYLIYLLLVFLFQIIKRLDFVKYKMHNDGIHNAYEITDIFALNKILKDINIKSTDCILDIGCGKGAALYVFSKYFKNICGVEFDKELYSICRNNIKKLNIHAKIINTDINDYIIPEYINYVFMFNPFSGTTMENTALKIKSGTVLIYHNPLCEDILYKSNFVKLKEYRDILGININVYKKL